MVARLSGKLLLSPGAASEQRTVISHHAGQPRLPQIRPGPSLAWKVDGVEKKLPAPTYLILLLFKWHHNTTRKLGSVLYLLLALSPNTLNDLTNLDFDLRTLLKSLKFKGENKFRLQRINHSFPNLRYPLAASFIIGGENGGGILLIFFQNTLEECRLQGVQK